MICSRFTFEIFCKLWRLISSYLTVKNPFDIYEQTFLNNSLLAIFGMLQRAPETSQREILNNLSSSEGVMNLPKLYYMVDVTIRYSLG